MDSQQDKNNSAPVASPPAGPFSWSSIISVAIGGLVALFVPSFYAVPRIDEVLREHQASVSAAARAGISIAAHLRSHWVLFGLAALVVFVALGFFAERLRGRNRLLAALLVLVVLLCYPVFLFMALYGPVHRL